MMQPLLQGKVAVVTGAAQGIGLEIARTLHRQGALVILADVEEGAARRGAVGIDERDLAYVSCDVTSKEQVRALVSGPVDNYSRLDVLVNNAGITRDASSKKMTDVDFAAVLAVHSRGPGSLCAEPPR